MDVYKFVINLPDRNDRRVEMEQQLRRVGWQATFQHADRPTSADGFPSIGAHGCFKSHLATLKRGLAMNGHVLIMEDDLDFTPGFSRAWNETYAKLQETEWSIFYPGHTLDDLPDGLSVVSPSTGIVCAHFVLVNRSAVQTIIDGLETILSRSPGHPLGGPMHVDGAYSTIREQNSNLMTYAASPVLGKQRSSRSDIADLKFFDRIETLRPLMNRLRRFKL